MPSAFRLRRLACPSDQLRRGRLNLTGPQAHQLSHVWRLQVGDPLELFDGTGHVARAILIEWTSHQVELDIEEIWLSDEPSSHLTVAVACPKGERADWLTEKLTELGVARLQWLVCARSVRIPGHLRQKRWERISQAASSQARRTHRMAIGPPMDLTRFIQEPFEACRLLAHPNGIVWPSANRTHAHASTILLVGPEGGFNPEELCQAHQAGYTSVRFGRHTLRVETAALAGAAILLGTGF